MGFLGTPEFAGKGMCLPASDIEIVLESKQGSVCKKAK